MSIQPTKQLILDEIKRVAAKNGGKPPGQDTFLDETGISISSWRGRYCARWNEAVAEAGLTPNIRTQRIHDDLLYEKIIEACRHYQKLPTQTEMQMFRRQNDGFPFFALRTRSSRGTLWSEFQSWLNDHPNEYADVKTYFDDNTQDAQAEATFEGKTISSGFVYLMRSGDHYKIGKSEDIKRRVKEIRTQMPESLVLIHTIRTDDTAGIEQYWHGRFQDKRLNGEWFKLSRADVAAFKKRSFQ